MFDKSINGENKTIYDGVLTRESQVGLICTICNGDFSKSSGRIPSNLVITRIEERIPIINGSRCGRTVESGR